MHVCTRNDTGYAHAMQINVFVYDYFNFLYAGKKSSFWLSAKFLQNQLF